MTLYGVCKCKHMAIGKLNVEIKVESPADTLHTTLNYTLIIRSVSAYLLDSEHLPPPAPETLQKPLSFCGKEPTRLIHSHTLGVPHPVDHINDISHLQLQLGQRAP